VACESEKEGLKKRRKYILNEKKKERKKKEKERERERKK
jgi:hypothetical protein